MDFRKQEETQIMESIIRNGLLCRDYAADVGVVFMVACSVMLE